MNWLIDHGARFVDAASGKTVVQLRPPNLLGAVR